MPILLILLSARDGLFFVAKSKFGQKIKTAFPQSTKDIPYPPRPLAGEDIA